MDDMFEKQLREAGMNNDTVPPESMLEEASRFVSEYPNAKACTWCAGLAAKWLLGMDGST